MKFKFSFCISFVGTFFAGLLLIQSPQKSIAIAAPTMEAVSHEQINQLKQDDLIYLGENHDRPEHHAAQLEIITNLHQEIGDSSTQLAVGFEMFQRPFQPMLDRYLAGAITEAELREQTEYDRRWGFDWEFYAPILRFAQKNQIPLIALNTPEEITRKIAETGIDSLEGSDFRYIPQKAQIKLDNSEYRQKMAEIYLSHLEAGQGNSSDRDNFFAAQVLWDETMADAIARYYQSFPQSQIVVLVGKAHIMNDYAIPDRVARRIEDKSFSQTSLLLGEN